VSIPQMVCILLIAMQRVGRIHVQRKTWGVGQNIECELADCRDTKRLAVGSNLHFECVHITSTFDSPVPQTSPVLKVSVLDNLIADKVFKQKRRQELIDYQQSVEEAGSFLSVAMNIRDGCSKRYRFVSIASGTVHTWSVFKRCVVTFDSKNGSFVCKCDCGRQNCVHAAVARWHLQQTCPELWDVDQELSADSQILTSACGDISVWSVEGNGQICPNETRESNQRRA
jgi:hypothetical protein